MGSSKSLRKVILSGLSPRGEYDLPPGLKGLRADKVLRKTQGFLGSAPLLDKSPLPPGRVLARPSPRGEFFPRLSRGEGEYKESVQVEQEDHGDPDSNVTELIIQPELQNPTSISKTLKQDKN